MHQFSTQWVTQFGIESEIWSLETRDECKRMSLENFKHLLTYWCNIVKSKQFLMHLKDSFQIMQCHCHNIHTRGWKYWYLSYAFYLGHYPKSAAFLVRIYQELHCHLLFTIGYLISVSDEISPRISVIKKQMTVEFFKSSDPNSSRKSSRLCLFFLDSMY